MPDSSSPNSRRHGPTNCNRCGQFSSARTCWTCTVELRAQPTLTYRSTLPLAYYVTTLQLPLEPNRPSRYEILARDEDDGV